jgi:hypothetical protein
VGNKQFVIGEGVDEFLDFNPADASGRSLILLFAGNFTGPAAGAIFIIDEHSIF